MLQQTISHSLQINETIKFQPQTRNYKEKQRGSYRTEKNRLKGTNTGG